MKFKYFRDPNNFAYKLAEICACSICGKTGLWFDASVFHGEEEIDSICDDCLADGKLESLQIETNTAYGADKLETNIIRYRTPSLPTWQETHWPQFNGEYCIFERFASKADFASKDEFVNSFTAEDQATSNLDWLWKTLPNKRIRNHKDGNFDVTVYLFTCENQKLCIWDAN